MRKLWANNFSLHLLKDLCIIYNETEYKAFVTEDASQERDVSTSQILESRCV